MSKYLQFGDFSQYSQNLKTQSSFGKFCCREFFSQFLVDNTFWYIRLLFWEHLALIQMVLL